jgi:hypothetical protein
LFGNDDIQYEQDRTHRIEVRQLKRSPRLAASFISNQTSNVAYWHLTEISVAPAFVRFWSNSGDWPGLALNGSVANDPKRTLAVHCGNGFDAGFSPYRSTHLSRYDASS